jgi:hypothetical protein
MNTMQSASAVGARVPSHTSNTRQIGTDLVDAYMAQYAGRDGSVCSRLQWWCDFFGNKPVHEIIDDDIHAGLERRALPRRGGGDLPDFFGPLISGKMALLGKRRADEKEQI